jgi:hypothetical protein
MMVMLGFKKMTPLLCQVVPYPSLDGNDEHTERKFSLRTKCVPFSPFEDDEISTFDEYDDQMVEDPTN